MTIAQRFSVGSSRARGTSPEGTAEPGGTLSRPFGTGPFARLQPNAKALGYYHMSLRDDGLARDRVFPKGIGFRPMASCVSALSGIVANGRRVMLTLPPPPLFIPYGESSRILLEASLVAPRPSAAVPGCV